MNRTRTTLGSTDTEVRATLTELLRALDPDSEYELRNEDFVADMPQSGERIRGRDAMRELQRAFPPDTKPTFAVRRITGAGELWTVEAEGDYGGRSSTSCSSSSFATARSSVRPGTKPSRSRRQSGERTSSSLTENPHRETAR